MLIDVKQPDKWLIGLLLCAEPQVGAVTIRELLAWLKEKELTLGQFWRQKEKLGQMAGLTAAKIAALKKIGEKFGNDERAGEKLKEYLQERKIKLCINDELDFPPLLKLITDCPAGLFYQGDLTCLQKLCLSVVGTRQITGYGRRVIKELLAPPLNEITIVSGMMTGVDEAAHRQALAIGGKTAAVLGYGLELTWPRYLATLRTEIEEREGVVVSEYAPWSEPQPFRFPVRNRLVAGLSLATLIVEAATKSGSLITANLALEAGREVLLVPGSIFSSLSNGTLGLLQVGATPVTKTAEIVAALMASRLTDFSLPMSQQVALWQKIAWQERCGKKKTLVTKNKQWSEPQQKLIYDLLQQSEETGLTSETIAEQLQLDLGEISTHLSLMELKGDLQQNQAGKWEIG